jgi:hypothetical protein
MNPPRGVSYLTSERFIHDGLLVQADMLVNQMLQAWRERQHFEAFAVTWPGEAVTDDNGEKIDQAVVAHLPEEATDAERRDMLKQMIARTKAYGVALTERRENELRVLFETHHGARAWIVPLKRHGDVLVPGPIQVRDDTECLGLLWSPHQGTT